MTVFLKEANGRELIPLVTNARVFFNFFCFFFVLLTLTTFLDGCFVP